MAKLTDLSVSFLSLVKTPATGKGLTLKHADGERPAVFDLVVKNDEMMRAYGIVYAPDQEDAHGDVADVDTIRRAATEFMREGRLKNIDTEHSFNNEMAFVAECWLVRKGDALFPDEPEGAWAVGIQIGDPDLWKQLKSGDLTGISLAGVARMEPEPDDPSHTRYTEKDAEIGLIARLVKALTGAPQDPIEETEMDKNEVQDIVRETLKSEIGDTIKDALKSAGLEPVEQPSEIESAVAKAVAAELKKHGIEPKEPSAGDGGGGDDDPAEGQTEIEKAIAKALKPFETKIEDKITKALAKGEIETGPTGAASEESFT